MMPTNKIPLRALGLLFAIVAIGSGGLSPTSLRVWAGGGTATPVGNSPNTQNTLTLLNRLGIGAVHDVYWSADGQQMAFIGPSGVWRYAYNQQGKPQRLIDYAMGKIYAADLNPSWSVLAVANAQGNFQVWDVAAHKMKISFDDTSRIEAVAVSADGKWAASVSVDRVVHLWDVASGNMKSALTPSIPGRCFLCGSIAFTPDSKLLATTITYPNEDDAQGNTLTPTPGWKNGEINFWDLNSGQVIRTLKTSDGSPVSHITFSPDGKLVAGILNGGSEESYQVWDLKTGALKQHDIFGLGDGNITFSPDGKLLAMIGTSEDSALSVVDLATDKSRFDLTNSEVWGGAGRLAFSPDGRLLAHAGSDGAVRVWRATDGNTARQFSVTGDTEDMAFSPDGKTLATISGSSAILLWDVGSGTMKGAFESRPGYLNTIAFTPDGKFLVTGDTENKIKVWNAATGKIVNSVTVSDATYSYRIDHVLISPDGKRLITFQFNSAATEWELPSLKKIRMLDTNNFLAFNPDGTSAAVQTKDGTIALLDMASGTPRYTIAHKSSVVAFSKDGALLAIPEAEHIYLWRIDKNELAQTLTTSEVQSMTAEFIAFKADGKSLVTVYSSHDDTNEATTLFIRLWEIDKTGSILVQQLEGDYQDGYALSSDTKILATTSRDDIALWALP